MSGVESHPRGWIRAALPWGALLSALGGPSSAQVFSQQKISDTQGGFTGTLDVVDFFGHATASPVSYTHLTLPTIYSV